MLGLRIAPKEGLGRSLIADVEELVESQLPKIVAKGCLEVALVLTLLGRKSHPVLMLPGCCPTVAIFLPPAASLPPQKI